MILMSTIVLCNDHCTLSVDQLYNCMYLSPKVYGITHSTMEDGEKYFMKPISSE